MYFVDQEADERITLRRISVK